MYGDNLFQETDKNMWVLFCMDLQYTLITSILQCSRCVLWVWQFDLPGSAQLKDIKHNNLKLYH